MKIIRNILLAMLVLAVGYYLISPKQHRLPADYKVKETTTADDKPIPVDNTLLDKIYVYYYDKNDSDCINPVPVEFTDLDMRKRFAEITSLNALLTHTIPDKYKSAIISGTQLNQFSVRNGVATIDMGPFMNLNIGNGKCSWAARKVQVIKTVNQFNTYKNIIITVEGKPVN